MDAQRQDDSLIWPGDIDFRQNPVKELKLGGFDVQYNRNYTTIKSWIEMTEGQIWLGKKDLWELGISTPAPELARAVREDVDVDEPIPPDEKSEDPSTFLTKREKYQCTR